MSRGGVPEQRLRVFAEAYAASGNGVQAAKAAGYRGKSKTLSDAGARLLRHPTVKRLMAELAAQKSAALRLTREQRQEFWSAIVRGDVVELDVVNPVSGKVKRVKMKPTVVNRLKASELLGKSEGDFVIRAEVKHVGQVRVTVDLPDNGRDDGPPAPTE